MSFEEKTITMTMFRLSDKLPDDVLDLLNARRANKLDCVGEEMQIGWSSGLNLLDTTIDENTSIAGGFIKVNLRFAERKIPASFTRELQKREEYLYMQSFVVDFVPKKAKKEIREDIKEKFLHKFPPTVSGVELVIDQKFGYVYAGTCSESKIAVLSAMFLASTGVELIRLDASEMIYEYYKLANTSNKLDFNLDFNLDIPDFVFSSSIYQDEKNIGRDFLTWLWYYSETEKQEENFQFMIDGSMKLGFMHTAQGATETTASKGIPQKSSEVKAALLSGKKLCKTGIIFTVNNEIFSFIFNADNFGIYSLKLPDGECLDRHSKFMERITNLHIFRHSLQRLFSLFCLFATSESFKEKQAHIIEWAETREAE